MESNCELAKFIMTFRYLHFSKIDVIKFLVVNGFTSIYLKHISKVMILVLRR